MERCCWAPPRNHTEFDHASAAPFSRGTSFIVSLIVSLSHRLIVASSRRQRVRVCVCACFFSKWSPGALGHRFSVPPEAGSRRALLLTAGSSASSRAKAPRSSLQWVPVEEAAFLHPVGRYWALEAWYLALVGATSWV